MCSEPLESEEIIRGIPATKWIHVDLMDKARMTDKQRAAYWYTMGRAQIALLMKAGNYVGEKPDREPSLDQWVKEHEKSYQRALAYQMELVSA